jgi:hypothetical protein
MSSILAVAASTSQKANFLSFTSCFCIQHICRIPSSSSQLTHVLFICKLLTRLWAKAELMSWWQLSSRADEQANIINYLEHVRGVFGYPKTERYCQSRICFEMTRQVTQTCCHLSWKRGRWTPWRRLPPRLPPSSQFMEEVILFPHVRTQEEIPGYASITFLSLFYPRTRNARWV